MNGTFHRKQRWLPIVGIWLGAIALFSLVAVPVQRAAATLGEPAVVSGYSLFALMVFLAAFNLRKRISMLPLIKAHWWTTVHVVGGVLGGALYFLHTGELWPGGIYERGLALMFYLVMIHRSDLIRH